MKNSLVVLLVALSGCYTPVISLDGYIPDKEVAVYPTVDSLRKAKYMENAYRAIKDIPVVDGLSFNTFAAGTSVGSAIASFLTLSGTGRKVVLDKEQIYEHGYVAIVHEDIHHLDDMDRDGISNWINHDVFLQAYKLLAKDYRYKGIQLWCETVANDWVTNTFGVGPYAEHIAYLGMFLSQGKPAPEYLKAVFARILKVSYYKESAYVTTTGERFKITAGPDSIKLEPLRR